MVSEIRAVPTDNAGPPPPSDGHGRPHYSHSRTFKQQGLLASQQTQAANKIQNAVKNKEARKRLQEQRKLKRNFEAEVSMELENLKNPSLSEYYYRRNNAHKMKKAAEEQVKEQQILDTLSKIEPAKKIQQAIFCPAYPSI